MNYSEQDIKKIVEEVLRKVGPDTPAAPQPVVQTTRPAYVPVRGTGSDKGIFSTMEEAIQAATVAQKELSKLSLEIRENIIQAMRDAALKNVQRLAAVAVDETGMGRVEDKIRKNTLAITKTPGIEDCRAEVYTGDWGLTLIERAPYGVIGSITPSTNPSETVICNGIGMIAAGNSVVFNGHPGAKKVTKLVIQILNEAIVSAGGPANLLASVSEPSIETGNIMMKHPGIRLLVVTGGPAVVKAAFGSGKKVIAAGPGNPPVIVDETADIPKAARDIVLGATLDNNVLCIAEKEIIVLNQVADQLVKELQTAGSYLIAGAELEKLLKVVLNPDGTPNRKLVGRNADFILRQIGVHVPPSIRMIIAETDRHHVLVEEEMLMPVLPVIRVSTLDEAIDIAVEAEHGFGHTAMMHSKNIANLDRFARAINTSIFVKNGPSCAGLGFTGEGPTTFTIASPTGEGITTARTFTRQRRCVLKDYFRII